MRTCGDCGWRSDDVHEPGWGECTGTLWDSKRHFDWRRCFNWKPKRDWRDETCGTCEFQHKVVERCFRGPGSLSAPDLHPACAEWRPREE